MPLIIHEDLPAARILASENIFTYSNNYVSGQNIRPLKIAILNLMPLKEATELHLLRLLSKSPLLIRVDLIHTATYKPTNTEKSHLTNFYKTFDDIKPGNFDGMIFTGAPVELLNFEDVKYWREMEMMMDWALDHVRSSLFICWAAQAGLYHHYGIPKYPLNEKLFGVYEHQKNKTDHLLLHGFDDKFLIPHSRHTELREADIKSIHELEVLSFSEKAGVYIVGSKKHAHFFITGHSEYDALTLRDEYFRDIKKGLQISVPENYFPDDDPANFPIIKWRSHADLLFSNWINFFVTA